MKHWSINPLLETASGRIPQLSVLKRLNLSWVQHRGNASLSAGLSLGKSKVEGKKRSKAQAKGQPAKKHKKSLRPKGLSYRAELQRLGGFRGAGEAGTKAGPEIAPGQAFELGEGGIGDGNDEESE